MRFRSRTTRKFRDLYAELPAQVQRAANEAYGLFRLDPSHPSLQFKKVHATLPIYSARIDLNYRSVGILSDGDLVVWFWVGSHSDYERLLKSL